MEGKPNIYLYKYLTIRRLVLRSLFYNNNEIEIQKNKNWTLIYNNNTDINSSWIGLGIKRRQYILNFSS